MLKYKKLYYTNERMDIFMLGSLLTRIREEKGLSKTTLADLTGINVGHLTHIEKGERKPSPNALKDICKALEIPYQPISYTFDKELDEDQKRFNLVESIPYKTVPLVSNIEDMVVCPSSFSNVSIAFRVPDDTMKASAPKGSIVFLEFSTIPLHRELGLFKYENSILLRRIVYRKNKVILKSDNLLVRDIVVEDNSKFTIIGKVYVEN